MVGLPDDGVGDRGLAAIEPYGKEQLGASILLVLTAPLMLIIAIAIRRGSPGPIFFRQTRLGIDMREFAFLKFRTMYEGTEAGPHRAYIESTMD